MSFKSEFDLESGNAIKAVQEVVRVTAFTAFNTAINMSPVGNSSLWKSPYTPDGYVGGNFRSNFFLSTDRPSTKTTKSTREKAKRQKELQVILTGDYSDNYILANNLPYAQRIDSGWSTQSPAGITNPVRSMIEQKIPRFQKAADKKFGVS